MVLWVKIVFHAFLGGIYHDCIVLFLAWCLQSCHCPQFSTRFRGSLEPNLRGSLPRVLTSLCGHASSLGQLWEQLEHRALESQEHRWLSRHFILLVLPAWISTQHSPRLYMHTFPGSSSLCSELLHCNSTCSGTCCSQRNSMLSHSLKKT